jgi:hypothetical protein
MEGGEGGEGGERREERGERREERGERREERGEERGRRGIHTIFTLAEHLFSLSLLHGFINDGPQLFQIKTGSTNVNNGVVTPVSDF